MREVAHGKRGKAYNCKENNRFIGCLQALSVFLICSLISLFCAAAGTSVQVLRILHTARDGSDVPLLDVPTLHTLKYTRRRAVAVFTRLPLSHSCSGQCGNILIPIYVTLLRYYMVSLEAGDNVYPLW